MDFFEIAYKNKQGGVTEYYPNFLVRPSKDLMVRGKAFYAIWDEEQSRWSTNPYDVQRLVDKELYSYVNSIPNPGPTRILTMSDFSSNMWTTFDKYVKSCPDTSHQLDTKLTFLGDKVKKSDYTSKTLPYSLQNGDFKAFDELMEVLYFPEERAKLEWAIGSIVAGDSIKIQKFVVLYGEAGTGKSTFLNILQMLFEGYYTMFEANALTSANNQFALEQFKGNPLVAIQHDGDLSRIEDNTKLNSLVAHEEMTINEKHKPLYTAKSNAFLFMGTNRPVKITDAKSGVIRRLIDVHPTGEKIPAAKYQQLMDQIPFELGAIAKHCLDVYLSMGKHYYDSYRPYDMILKTDVFFNFIEAYYFEFKDMDKVTLKQAYDMYKAYCDEARIEYPLARHKFREELKNYFRTFKDVGQSSDGRRARSVYEGFIFERVDMSGTEGEPNEQQNWLKLDQKVSIIDSICSDCPAQYGNEKEIPLKKWEDVTTTLKDIDTSKLHYVRVPLNHIVIDFDLKDESGQKSPEKNISAASKWPPTYAEFSKGGNGIHLHYIYEGDPEKLAPLYEEGIEVKVFKGKSSLRRKLSLCNTLAVAVISSGLPLKGEKKVLNMDRVESEKHLRAKIEQNLRKEVHPGTKPSVDFIYKILEDAYNSGMHYDVTDLRPKVLNFALKSTNHAQYCVSLVNKMKFKSEEISDPIENKDDDRLVFFDIEVFPNLFLVNWKYDGSPNCVRMINPTPSEIEGLFSMKLVGFNNRRYDNHILYARYLGYSNEELYNLSKRIIEGSPNSFINEAYNVSYTDVYDFASAQHKKSLKKFEIELGIHHQELGLPWDQPVPEEKWVQVAEYCDNDVIATEAVFHHLKGDWIARQILAELSGLTVNDTTNQHSTRIILGKNKKPQSKFNYRNLAEPVKYIPIDMEEFLEDRTTLDLHFDDKSILPYFPGYKKEFGKSTYRGEEVGEGGYVYAEPGMYFNVALLDVASMHPTSAEDEFLFGEYTWAFSDIKQGRICIKHKDIERLKTILDGKMAPFVERALADDSDFSLKDLSNALKTVINSVYGLTSASFEHPFHDPRNIDNIVAKRGALFMIDLKHAVQEKGFAVAHIKTDSIKIPNATPEIIQFVMDFGRKYGYEFEHEATYERMCLVNDAVYIAKYDENYPLKEGETPWTATGDQFARPYVFKTIFSKENMEFKDYIEVKSVTKGDIYIDFNEDLPEGESNLAYVGRVGAFIPVQPGTGGGILYRISDGKRYAVAGSKGYRWREAEEVASSGLENTIDLDYYSTLASNAISTISEFGDFYYFVEAEYDADGGADDNPPWDCTPCHHEKYMSCTACPHFHNDEYHFDCDQGYDIMKFFDENVGCFERR